MKRYLICALAAIVALASCTKEGPARFRGNYSFKTSGAISAARDSLYWNDTTYQAVQYQKDTTIHIDSLGIDTTITVTRFRTDTVITVMNDTMTFSLATEAGQMDVTTVDSEAGEMLVTMNVTGGEMVVYEALAKGEDITILPSVRHMALSSASAMVVSGPNELEGQSITGDVEIEGSGKRYENIILFTLSYSGDFTFDDRLYHIVGSDVVCRAKLNE